MAGVRLIDTHPRRHEALDLLWHALELVEECGTDADTLTIANGMLHEAGRIVGHRNAARALDIMRSRFREIARGDRLAREDARHAAGVAIFGNDLADHHSAQWHDLYHEIMSQGGIRLGSDRADYVEDVPVCLRRNNAPYQLDQFASWAGHEYTDQYVAHIAATYRAWKSDTEGAAA